MSYLMHDGLIIIVGEIVQTTPPVGSVVKCHRRSISAYFITTTLGEEVFSTLKLVTFSYISFNCT